MSVHHEADSIVVHHGDCLDVLRDLPLIVQRLNRRTDPVAAVKAADGDNGLFDLFEEGA